jgi:hypothetical protein
VVFQQTETVDFGHNTVFAYKCSEEYSSKGFKILYLYLRKRKKLEVGENCIMDWIS